MKWSVYTKNWPTPGQLDPTNGTNVSVTNNGVCVRAGVCVSVCACVRASVLVCVGVCL